MDRLRVGVIGAGVMGERHARIYASLPEKPIAVALRIALAVERAAATGSAVTP